MAVQVTRSQIKDDAIDGTKIADDAVGTAALQLNANFSFTGQISSTNTPTSSNDIVNKSYVDSLVNGLNWRKPARVMQAPAFSNVTYATQTITNAGTQAALTIDGVSLSANDRVLVFDNAQTPTAAARNGVYEVTTVGDGSTNWVLTRVAEMDSADEFDGSAIYVKEGTSNADTVYTFTNTPATLGTSDIELVEFGAGITITGGNGITVSNNEISIDLAPNSGLYDQAGAGANQLTLNLLGLSVLGTVASGDLMAFADVSDPNSITKKRSVSDFLGDIAGTGLIKNSTNDGLEFSGNELTTAVADISVANDFILYVDQDDSSASKKITVDSFLGDVIGEGIQQNGSSKKIEAKINTGKGVAVGASGLRVEYIPTYEIVTENASAVSSLDLDFVCDDQMFDSVVVYKNGLALLKKASPSTSDEYKIDNTGAGSVGKITFGSSISAGDVITCLYFKPQAD
jgi:hypothetical protein